MKHKHTHYICASFAFLLFVALGYMVKFYPEALTEFDSSIQTRVRGDLPGGLTHFFKTITILGNTSVQAIIAIVAVIWLYLRQYKSEAIFVGTSGVLASIMIVSLKYIYQRPRPLITHLVHASGYSFPSGHSLGTWCNCYCPYSAFGEKRISSSSLCYFWPSDCSCWTVAYLCGCSLSNRCFSWLYPSVWLA